ncbi:MAG: hypothetical protein ACP5U2_07870 [Bryobacteraceae bacterium]
MEQLGIRALRPGRSPRLDRPNAANYDEATANPFPDYPEILRLKDGRPVTTAEMWWKLRRPEIVEDFEREVYGRVPAGTPSVQWSVVETREERVGPFPVLARRIEGRVANPACPGMRVAIRMVVVTPAWAPQRVPLMIRYGRAVMPSDERPLGPPGFVPTGTDPPASEQLVANGWGYAWRDPGSIQPDSGAVLRGGIIGLVNCGRPRKPDDWGVL